MRNDSSCISAIYAAHRSTRVSTRLPDNDLDEQRCLMQLNVTERRISSLSLVHYKQHLRTSFSIADTLGKWSSSQFYIVAGQERVPADKFKDYHAYRR
ncbi:hypothetical protein M422DRAFT_262953 [Sphaerobolus stellatus SS14]|uniref:Uncharacterized protein n=1 Tax=Sphaerobolus stellatus (strain SS14) TaxID=990650 RepID=A0A0C9VCF0_SPHS4|nr:hypothetical protein M422DRAFT_262953 [Sphaerobolus stellatus SS14]